MTQAAGRQQFRIRLERDDIDGGWIAECLDLPGCMSQGETQDEALRNLADAMSEVRVLGPISLGEHAS